MRGREKSAGRPSPAGRVPEAGARPSPEPPLAPAIASAVRTSFDGYRARFGLLTRRAHRRFDTRDWHGFQNDSVERLEIYSAYVSEAIEALERLDGGPEHLRPHWPAAKAGFSDAQVDVEDRELAETFFNSVARKLFRIVGVDHDMEFASLSGDGPGRGAAGPLFTSHSASAVTPALITRILRAYEFDTPWFDLERDAMLVAGAIDAHLTQTSGSTRIDRVDIANPLFFRNKSAYVVGRIVCGGLTLPLVLPILNTDIGLVVDTVLTDEDDVSILFSFTRSYFHVDVDRPREMIDFLRTIMPLKPVAELYIAVGHNKHGKTEMYRELFRHLAGSTDKFEFARGDRGMVMLVFTLPSYDVVFKIIRDRFAYPKTTVRREVMEKYNLVFKHDRAGRLVDAQEFENLTFDRARFSDQLLDELKAQASESVEISEDRVVISHLYIERRLAPLNLYLREAAADAAREAVLDYGQTVKDLASTNIFPGDLLLKNFGVTRHGRVVFYDYDELCLLSECHFRALPEAADLGDEMQAEPWFYVAENDIFPEEFIHFLGLTGDLKKAFLGLHGDLLQPYFWLAMQQRHAAGEILDIFPYRREQRFPTLRD